jgi:hypothetical protein
MTWARRPRRARFVQARPGFALDCAAVSVTAPVLTEEGTVTWAEWNINPGTHSTGIIGARDAQLELVLSAVESTTIRPPQQLPPRLVGRNICECTFTLKQAV